MTKSSAGVTTSGPAASPSQASPADDQDDHELFSPINLGRASEAIIQQIRQLIHDGRLKEGARLPSERELCNRFGVSRVTIREALRVLEANGLIEIRVGARGGAFVTTPTSDRVEVGITDLLALSALTATEVTEARQLIDLGITRILCERATETDISDLYALCDAAEEALHRGAYSPEISTDFHVRLAQATHNRAISMLVQSMRRPIVMSLEQAQRVSPEFGGRGVAEHRALVAAIEDRDPERVEQIMAEHLSRTLKRVTEAAGPITSED